MNKILVIKPRMSEKAYGLSEVMRTYVFDIVGPANKNSISDAVSAQFKVNVIGVRVANIKGKTKRTVRKGGRAIKGNRSDIKKAYVTLKEGDKLPIFAAVEKAEEKEKKTAEKVKKIAEKTAKKEKS